jgi:integrase/recombinase XerD
MLKPAAASQYVFVTRTSPQMNSTVLGKSFRRNRAMNGLPRISPHTFRHAFCTNYLKNGGDVARLKTITGHKTYQMLDQYIKKAAQVSKVAHDELERVDMLKDC